MPTAFAHPVLPLAVALAGPRAGVSGTLLAAACLCSALPDFDVVAFAMGIPYSHPLGHRGASHSLVFALGMGLLGAWGCKALRAGRFSAFCWLFLATASHGILDAFTNGGLGVAFFWPISDARFFFPWRPLDVSPIGLRAFLEGNGWQVIGSEMRWIGLPCGLFVAMAWSWRWLARRRPPERQ